MRSLPIRLVTIYGIILVIAFSMIDGLLIYHYSQEQYQKEKDGIENVGEIIANLKNQYKDDVKKLEELLKQYSLNIQGRIILLDSEGKVLGDSLGKYNGRTISNKEIRKTIQFKESVVRHYTYNKKKVMSVTIPTFQRRYLNQGSQAIRFDGIILIAKYIQDVQNEINLYAKQVIAITLGVGSLFLLLYYLAGVYIASPIHKLTKASEHILHGKLGTQVEIQRKDEIGILANTFNKMSKELYNIEKNRRQLYSNVSHELKTPLAAIKSLIESLDENDDRATYQEYMEDINGEVDRLGNLVQSLLTVTRIEDLQLHKEYIRLHTFVEEINKLLNFLADKRGIQLMNDCDESIEILADKNALKEILVNLIHNSIRYGVIGGKTTIQTKVIENEIMLTIQDNGIGIPEEAIPRLFENFYRVDAARTKAKGGSGIGLYIVKKLIDLQDWRIEIRSKVSEGTEVHIFLKDFRVV